jgi:hypothetical protein
MPKFIWVAEISTLEKYKHRQIIGEIIIDATASVDDEYSFLHIHYPGILRINDRNLIGEADPESRYTDFSDVAELDEEGKLIIGTYEERPEIDTGFGYDIYFSNLKEGGD